MSEPAKTFHARDRETWRRWLEQHASVEREVWLVLFKRDAGEPSVRLEEAVEEALCFGWIDGLVRRIDERQHMVRFTPRRRDSRWSENNKQRVERLIAAGRMTSAGLELVEHARRSGEWEAASGSLRDQPMPDELRCALEKDPESQAWFEGLAPSHRRQYLGWIHEAKRTETRLRRIARTLEMIRNRIKPGI
ncbi:MAG: YdeI/OmpD-associated family protein [Acidobacteriota bacterium]